MVSKKNKKDLSSWGDLAKKVVYAGLGSAAMAREAMSNTQWQKDLVGGLLSAVERRKEDLMEMMAHEVSKFLGKINVSEEISKALHGLVINLNASIDFKKGKKGMHPTTTIHHASAEKKSNS